MKNRGTAALVAVTILFLGFTLGFFLGRNTGSRVTVLSQPVEQPAASAPTTPPADSREQETGAAMNINTASVPELSTLPGIGKVIAQRIADYRAAHGPFTDVTQLAQVEGIGEKRLEELLPLITTGG